MRRAVLLSLGLFAAATATARAETLKFWNLTENTITQLQLAAPGTDKWGKNQCLNDNDKTVSSDERLKLSDVTPGRYDVRIKDKKGRTCVLRNVELKGGEPYAFSVSEQEMKACPK